MKVYTYSHAPQKLAKLLDEARNEGEVAIKKRDGQTFIFKLVEKKGSPLDIDGMETDLDLNVLNEAVRESRERLTKQCSPAPANCSLKRVTPPGLEPGFKA